MSYQRTSIHMLTSFGYRRLRQGGPVLASVHHKEEQDAPTGVLGRAGYAEVRMPCLTMLVPWPALLLSHSSDSIHLNPPLPSSPLVSGSAFAPTTTTDLLTFISSHLIRERRKLGARAFCCSHLKGGQKNNSLPRLLPQYSLLATLATLRRQQPRKLLPRQLRRWTV